MAEQDVSTEILRPTGLTPATEEAPPSYQEESTAAPPDEGEARPEDYPADSEATDEAPAVHAEEQKKPARGVQKALDRLRAERAQADRRAELEATRANLAETQLRQIAWEQQQRQVQRVQEKPPEMKDFSDWGEFNRATASFVAKQEARQLVRQEFQGLAAGIAQHQQTQVQAQRGYAIDQKIAEAATRGSEKIADWDDVVASDLPVTPALKRAIARADDPAIAMHYLAKHPAEHMRLVQMDPEDMLFTAGKMFSGRSNISKAPAPGRPVGGRSSGPTDYRDDFTPSQHKAWLAKQGR